MALRSDDHALWGSAFYAGLRMGELRALRWSDIDLAAGVIRVERAMDQKGSTIHPKSVAGLCTVPIPKALRSLLAAHRLHRVGEGYVFGSSLSTPFTPSAVLRRARLRWSKVEALKPLADFGLHEARHTFASLMIDAGVNAKALTEHALALGLEGGRGGGHLARMAQPGKHSRSIKDIGRRGQVHWQREAWTLRQQSNNPEKVFIIERFRLAAVEGERAVEVGALGDVEYRFGYFIVGRIGRAAGRWTWGQYSPFVPSPDLGPLLRQARAEGTILVDDL